MAAPTIINDNKACCTLPPVVANYEQKGTFEEMCGLRTYIVGPKDAKKAIVYVYDLFAFSAQALQGADILASGGDTLVVMPDFFKGSTIDASNFGADKTPAWLFHQCLRVLSVVGVIVRLIAWVIGDRFIPATALNEPNSKAKAVQEFFAGPASPDASAGKLAEVIKNLRTSGAEKVGAVGFCWGAKVCIHSPDLDAIALVHPSLLVATDADSVSVPVALLPSKNENLAVMEALKTALEKKDFASKNVYERFPESSHGAAAARADLTNEAQRNTYHRVYEILTSFFNRNLDVS